MRLCFSSVEDLEKVFRKGIRIVFRPLLTNGGLCWKGGVYEVYINIEDSPQEQNTTLVHELIHAFHHEHWLLGLVLDSRLYRLPLLRYFGVDKYEDFVESKSRDIVANQSNLLRAVIDRLHADPRCTFVYM